MFAYFSESVRKTELYRKHREQFANVVNVKSPSSQLINDRRPYEIVCEKSFKYYYLTEDSEENCADRRTGRKKFLCERPLISSDISSLCFFP